MAFISDMLASAAIQTPASFRQGVQYVVEGAGRGRRAYLQKAIEV